jgi:hypothetical protein
LAKAAEKAQRPPGQNGGRASQPKPNPNKINNLQAETNASLGIMNSTDLLKAMPAEGNRSHAVSG